MLAQKSETVFGRLCKAYIAVCISLFKVPAAGQCDFVYARVLIVVDESYYALVFANFMLRDTEKFVFAMRAFRGISYSECFIEAVKLSRHGIGSCCRYAFKRVGAEVDLAFSVVADGECGTSVFVRAEHFRADRRHCEVCLCVEADLFVRSGNFDVV